MGRCVARHPGNNLQCIREEHSQTGPSFQRFHRAERDKPSSTHVGKDVWLWRDGYDLSVLEEIRQEYERLGAYKEPVVELKGDVECADNPQPSETLE